MEQRDFAQMCLGIQSYRMKHFTKYIPYGIEYKYFAGESIKVPGDDNYIFYITKGCFRIVAERLDGGFYDVAYCHADTILQANILVVNSPYPDPVQMVATENSVVIRFTRQQLYQFIQQDQDLFNEYVDNSSVYAGVLRERLLITSNISSSQRLLNWLEKLCQTEIPSDKGVYTIACDLTQQQIANLLFIHVTTCNKFFMKLSKEKIAKHLRGKIVVYDLDKLRMYRDEKLKLL